MPSLWPLTGLFILPAIGSALRWAVPWLRDTFSAMFSNRQWESILWQNDPGSGHLRQIGQGQCGTIWTLVGSRDVMKIPNPGKADQLWNDCCTHRMIEETLRTTPVDLRRDISIPQFCTWTQLIFSNPTNEARHKRPTYALVSSRIDPVTESLRREVVITLAPPYANKRSILAPPENKDCLIRLYLGRRGERSDTQAFRLRNFDLMVNEMEELRLDIWKFAAVMAKTLAILHWSVRVDADDVEFVLGRSPIHKMPPSASELTGSNKDDARFLCQGSTPANVVIVCGCSTSISAGHLATTTMG